MHANKNDTQVYYLSSFHRLFTSFSQKLVHNSVAIEREFYALLNTGLKQKRHTKIKNSKKMTDCSGFSTASKQALPQNAVEMKAMRAQISESNKVIIDFNMGSASASTSTSNVADDISLGMD